MQMRRSAQTHTRASDRLHRNQIKKKEPKNSFAICVHNVLLSLGHAHNSLAFRFVSFVHSLARFVRSFFYISKMASYVSKIKIFGNRIE